MIHFLQSIWYWFEVHSGTVNESGPYYGFWSGFGSDIGEFLLLGSIVAVYRKHNCYINRCPRIAHHKLTDNKSGTEHMLCKKHYRQIHPELPKKITLEHLAFIHHRNQKDTYEH